MIQDTVVIGGECSLETRIEGDCDLTSMVEGDPDVLVVEGGGQTYPHYSGSYVVTPSTTAQVLDTDGKVMDNDVTIQAVTQGSATTPATIITADPTISVSSGGLITATVSKTQQITPTVVEGYVETGTPGNVGVSGSNTEQLSTQGAQTIHPASADQSIASGKYLTGNQTFKAVTVSGLTADKILQGNVVKIGDADDDDRIMSVTGTASGGITPTGTKQITENGTGIDVYSYQYADVAVPNSYSASDEGKVVSNGALVAQTSDTVTANDTYDTTLIDELTVNVPTGGGFDIDDFIDHTQPQGAFTTTATSIPTQTFRERTGITSISAPNCTLIGGYGFYGCTALETVDFPELKSFGASDVFSSCTKLKGFIMPNGTGTLSSTNFIFRGCSKLKYFDGGVGITQMTGSNTFQNCTIFDTMVLRRTAGVTAIGTSTLSGTPFASDGTGGTLYVPQALISSYQSATNWSTILGYANNSIQAIEGSAYETTYADGTPISS